MDNLSFNPNPPALMHIDLNSCFASIEQQANPRLRGKPVVVAAYTTPSGCILASSIEAKKLGIKTGMRVKDARAIFPSLVVLAPDPDKYRSVHMALKKIISDYTNDFSPKSIDEFVLNLQGYPAFLRGMKAVAAEIKLRIKAEIGEWLTVSVGIGPNRYLAKIGAGLHKPDGLDEINSKNYLDIYSKLSLTGLCGIKIRNAIRLERMGIHSVLDFYNSPLWRLKAAFSSINGYYWYLRLRGWEIDDFDIKRKTFGNSYALPMRISHLKEAAPIIQKLCEKTGSRLRAAGYLARGVHTLAIFAGGSFWHKGRIVSKDIFDSRDIYSEVMKTFVTCPYFGKSLIRNLAISTFGLCRLDCLQLDLFGDVEEKREIVMAIDKVNSTWGEFVVAPARMLSVKGKVIDRISFNAIPHLNSFIA